MPLVSALFCWIFGLCSHRWSAWGDPLRDDRTDSRGTEWEPHSFQRRVCSKCGKIEQLDLGVTVKSDPQP